MVSNEVTTQVGEMQTADLTKQRARFVIMLLFVLLSLATIIALCLGSESISLAQLWAQSLSREQEVILFNIRLPRIALALGSGAALALAGAAFQALLRNPLADPYVLGVSSGAALGAIVGILFASQFVFARPLLSFAGASAATFVVYLLGRRADDPARLILAGVVISTLLASFMVLLTTLADDIRLRNITFWLLGDLSSGNSELILFLTMTVIGGGVVLFANARALNLMIVGERDAFSLGVETTRVRWIVFVTASLLTAAAVSTGGAIGYVGLVVPHLIRLAAGNDNRLVLPASALAGALLVLLADTMARTVIAPRELPTGAITALIGAPVMVYLLLGRGKFRRAETGKRAEVMALPLLPTSQTKPGAPLLQLKEVSFHYDHEILTHINLSVHAGEIVALLGPNGAGKSTLLNVAAGKLTPQSGAVNLQERNLAEFSRREFARHVALVAQASELHFPLTVLEYVLAGRFAHTSSVGFDSPADIDIARQALAATDAAHFATRLFNQLSSGEKQRVVLARALAQQPQLLLLDEPTANLDVAHQITLLELVQRLTREYGIGALIVTHEINLAAEYADRVALLRQGKIFASGAVESVMTTENLRAVFDAELAVHKHPQNNKPVITLIGKTQ
ncbi:MAG: iron chelate uptake ABC transporter family permease subunit [Acidobacteria bacterium]|nr:iron chelate uptake ABC transporter family permease subunit [Acidobacteriota bacterium]